MVNVEVNLVWGGGRCYGKKGKEVKGDFEPEGHFCTISGSSQKQDHGLTDIVRRGVWDLKPFKIQNSNTKHFVLLYVYARSFQNTSGVCLFWLISWEKASSDLTSSLQCSGSQVLNSPTIRLKWSNDRWMSARGGDALGAHEKTSGVVAQWSFNVHPSVSRKKNRRRLWATFIVVAPTVWRERNWRLLSMSKTMPTASKLSEAPSCRLISVPRWTFAKFSLKIMAWRGWGGEVSWQNAKCRDCRQKCTFESSKVKNHRRALFL